MKKILYTFPGNEALGNKLLNKSGSLQPGTWEFRHFPDGETYIRIDDDVMDAELFILCSLDRPDAKLLPLAFFSVTARDLGVREIHLIAPYLAYMRQDKRFHPGEAVSSVPFAKILSEHFDSLITCDPHLHRRKSLSEIYSIPTKVVASASAISAWIKAHVGKPLIIGPDEESLQWVQEVALGAEAPFLVLKKERFGDRDVKISIPQIDKYHGYTPVIVDDIVSTAKTMIETVKHLRMLQLEPVCLAVHAIFSGTAYDDLLGSGAKLVVSCNTIEHPSNQIDVSDTIRMDWMS